MQLLLPHKFIPRPYQLESNRSFFIHGKRFSIDIWHRRAGKTKNALNLLMCAGMQRVGNYYHTFPELTQARRVIWNGIDKDGFRYLDHIPKILIKGTINNTDMRIPLINGSSIQLAGADRYDALMGGNPAGIIFDEYSLQNPFAWHYLAPVITENGGWAKFIYCVKPDTLIFTENGLQEIGDIDNKFSYGFTDIDLNVYGLCGFQKATQFYKSRKCEVLKIVTQKGYELTCTPVHPIWNGTDWKQSKDFIVGDRISIQGHQNIFGNVIGWNGFEVNTHGHNKPIPFKPDHDFYYFLGLYIAEGCCTGTKGNKYNCVITIGDPEIHSWLTAFGFVPVKNRKDQSVNSNQNLCNLLDWLGCGSGALNKQIPRSVLQSPEWVQRAFLRGYFDGDGCSTTRGGVHADSISEKLIKYIQVMLLNFGIYSTRKKNKKLAITERAQGKHLCWRIEINGGDANIFFQKIGFGLDRKQSRCPLVNTYNHIIEVDYSKLPNNYFLGLNLSGVKRQFIRGIIRYRTLEKLHNIRPCEYLKELLGHYYRYDKIISIETEESEVVDFVIPETHSFTSNGFISHNTPRGANHGLELYNRNLDNPNWFVQKLDARQTHHWDGSPIITEAQINERRREGMPEELIEQEFYCSFDAALSGSYYSREITDAYQDNRITDFQIDRNLPVHTAWDLGRRDSNAIWMFQTKNEKLFLINYYENTMLSMEEYIKWLGEYGRTNGFRFGMHFGPHDIRVTEYSTGKSRIDHAASMGFYFIAVKRLGIMEGIDAVKRLFPQIHIHKTNCQLGLSSLKQYHRSDRGEPVHDFASHPADALRTMAVGWYQEYDNESKRHTPFTMERFHP